MDFLVYKLSDLEHCQLPDVLDAPEEVRAERSGHVFRTTRSLLKCELARRTGVSAASIHFTYGQHGKPTFEQQQFNVSHSGDCLCMAFHHAPVGVDVEQVCHRPMESLARRFMAKEQLRAFLKRGSRQEEFFFCWCAAEAFVKHTGDSIWNVSSYPFQYEEGRIYPLFSGAPDIHLFHPLPGYCGAIAFCP